MTPSLAPNDLYLVEVENAQLLVVEAPDDEDIFALGVGERENRVLDPRVRVAADLGQFQPLLEDQV